MPTMLANRKHVRRPTCRAVIVGLVCVWICRTAAADPVGKDACEELHGRAMGTRYSIKLVRPDGVTLDELGRASRDELERLEQIFSLYRSDSELSRLNAVGANEWHSVSWDLARVTARALELADATGGAFDPTIGPLTRLWKLREFSADWRPPSSTEIAAACESVGARFVEVRLDPPGVLKRRDGIELDLNALVEGWAIDRLIDLLRSRGVTQALVELGGEFRGIGRRPDGTPWRIGLEDPRDLTRLYARVVLIEAAVSTSGDYRQAVEFEGRTYSHLIDPRTGSPIRHGGAAVSVLAADAFTADGWATALLVLGPEEGCRVAESKGLAVSFVERQPGTPPRLSTAAIAQFDMLEEHQPQSKSHFRWLPLFAILGGAASVVVVGSRRVSFRA
jgi:FAD:protein FMN transferase